MVKPELGLLEVEMEVGARNASIVVKPDLGIREETLDAIDVCSSAGVLLFSMGYFVVSSPEREDPVSSIFVGEIDAPPPGMLEYEGKEGSPSSIGDGEGDDPAVSLIHTENHPLPFRSPAPLSLPPSTKEGLIELQFPTQGLHLFEGSIVDGLPGHPENPLGSGKTAASIEPGPIGRNAQTEKVEEVGEFIERKPDPLNISSGEIAEGIAATPAPESIPLTPEPPLCTPGASSPNTPSKLDKKSPAFWQARSQCNCLFSNHKNMVSQSQFFRHYLNY